MKRKFGLATIVLVAATLALVGALRDVGTGRGASPNVPDGPIKGAFPGTVTGGAKSTKLGDPLWTFSDTANTHGRRSAFQTSWAFGQDGNPDIRIDDGGPLGNFLSWSDIQCDAADNTTGIDLFAFDKGPPVDPWDFTEQDSDLYGNGMGWLVPSTSNFPVTARFFTDMPYVWLNGSTKIVLSSPVPVNILTLATNWSPHAGASQIFVSGAPTLPAPPGVCAQDAGGPTVVNRSVTNGSATSPVPMTNNPPIRGDAGGPCGDCSDFQVLGLWPSTSIVGSGTPVTVSSRIVNNGPGADGDFKEIWHVEVPTGVTALWGGAITKQTNAGGYPAPSWSSAGAPTATVSGNDLSFQEVAMPKGQTNSYAGSLTLTCSSAGDYIVTIKSMASPLALHNDNDLYNNVALSVMRVKCPVAAAEIDEQAAGLSSTVGSAVGDHIKLAVGATATAHYKGIIRNQSTVNNVVSKGALVAEALGVDNDTDYDITLNWLPVTAAGVYGSEPPATALPSFSAGCMSGGGLSCAGLDLSLTEPAGEMIEVSADLEIKCDEAGKFLVPVKLVTWPVNVGAVNYGDSIPTNNAFFNVATVYCGTFAGDGTNDSSGVYPEWSTNDFSGTNVDPRRSISPTNKPATAIGSDTAWADRLIDPFRIYYYSFDGATDTDEDGWIQPSESVDQAPAGIDQDEDGLANSGVAQPGQAVDFNDVPNLSDKCPAIVYNAGKQPLPEIQYTKAADQDCDGLVDGIEAAFGSNPRLADTDDDGANDFVEMFGFTSPLNPDTDGDGFKDKPADTFQNSNTTMDNCPGVYNPNQKNSDAAQRPNGPSIPSTVASQPNGDKRGDACDTDDDNDGLTDDQEPLCVAGLSFSCPPATCYCDLAVGTRPTPTTCQLNACNPLNSDTDSDRQVDAVELLCGSKPTDGSNKCGSLSAPVRAYLKGCHFDLPGNNDFKAFNGDLWVEYDPDGDGILCPADDDNDNGTFTGAGAPLELNDNIEALGYYTSIARRDTDGDGCVDWLEVMDINGDRVNSVGDLSALAKRGSPSPPVNFTPDPISDPIYDVNKDGLISVGDLSLMARNSCVIKPYGGGCAPQPCLSEQ